MGAPLNSAEFVAAAAAAAIILDSCTILLFGDNLFDSFVIDCDGIGGFAPPVPKPSLSTRILGDQRFSTVVRPVAPGTEPWAT